MYAQRFPASLWAALLLVTGCDRDAPAHADVEGEPAGWDAAVGEAPAADGRLVRYTEERAPCLHRTPLRRPLFGDLHVHTSYSFDAAANSIGAAPKDAYRFARGRSIDFWPLDEAGAPAGEFAIDRPLDFMAVTDHAEFLGENAICRSPESAGYDSPFCVQYRLDELRASIVLGQVTASEAPSRVAAICGEDGALCGAAAREPWRRIVAAAEAAYDRSEQCTFTSFVGYEYTGTPGVSNYHRNVIFRNANVPELPVSYIEAPTDSELWHQLDAACSSAEGCSYLTIPHNTNLANGRMGPYTGIGTTLDNRRAYAAERLEREPVVEIFQHKGNSECINGLSSVMGDADELCAVEAVRVLGRLEFLRAPFNMNDRLITLRIPWMTGECGDNPGRFGMLGGGCVDETDFVRSALLVGLSEARELGLNPIKLGIIASTDTHTATPGAVDEANYRGAISNENTPLERLQPSHLPAGPKANPGGLAGVWAMENSRDAIFEALQRRETFGTSGPRIAPRFFGGWEYAADLCGNDALVAAGYSGGVPMGGDLGSAPASDAAPRFLAFAARDPAEQAGPLQQLQLIKGWIDADGAMRSSVRTIAGSAAADTGAETLCAVVRDDDFDADEPAYYYVRAVEVPTPRWSTYDCRDLGTAAPAVCGDLPGNTVEMAWTSPIWYVPETPGDTD